MSTTDTMSSARFVSNSALRAHRRPLNYAQVHDAWRALGVASAQVHREATHQRSTTRLRNLTGGLFKALAAVGVPLPETEIAHNQAPHHEPVMVLSPRELEVLRGISQGKSNAAIGRDLFVTEDTVKTHARHLYRKLGAHDRAHAVAVGFQMGLLT